LVGRHLDANTDYLYLNQHVGRQKKSISEDG